MLLHLLMVKEEKGVLEGGVVRGCWRMCNGTCCYRVVQGGQVILCLCLSLCLMSLGLSLSLAVAKSLSLVIVVCLTFCAR